MDKSDIRRHVAASKTLLSDEEKISAAEQLFNRLEQLAGFIVADNILVYNSLPDELPTRRFIDKWNGRKRFFLPRVNGVNLDILPYEKSRLHLGAFQIEEPDGDELTPVDQIEVVIVPGIAYDRCGNRVGRGKGFYDRLLRDTRALKIGIGYDFQFFDELEADPHDVAMDIVVTDKRCVIVRR
ncbi:MAG: 5-formyltetrahydrofolate cyclo-ligase [Clostridium sp.]|nr:5-formyltetrahydrofolate cyclo-ligase [Clostridium sp.]